ncbi:unnamed protein product, partial [Cyprideis torosa]
MKKYLYSLILLAALQISWGQEESKTPIDSLPDGLYANMQTSKGDMLIRLFPKTTPLTVANFVGLAEGKIENKAKPLRIPYYDGLIFHRVIPGFMIQGGDPDGNGRGGPGYMFDDEFSPTLKHDKKGVLSMANAGPGTNGSQFFITEVPTPHLDGRHTVFGNVIEGLNVIDSIANVEVEDFRSNKPLENVYIKHINIIRKGNEYSSYNGGLVFDSLKLAKEEEIKRNIEAALNANDKGFKVTESGLRYRILEKNKKGKTISEGNTAVFFYDGKLVDGTLFASNRADNPLGIVIGRGSVIPGLEEGLTYLKEGESAIFLIPPDLAYGNKGVPGKIPPHSVVIYEDFDNVGLQVGEADQVVSKALCCLDVTDQVLNEAIENECNLIVTFHPLIFKPLKTLAGNDRIGRICRKAIQNHISIFAIHTNLDNQLEGVNKTLTMSLGLKNHRILMPKTGSLKQITTYIPSSDFEAVWLALSKAGAGKIGDYDQCAFGLEGEGRFRAGSDSNPHVGEKEQLHKEKEQCLRMVFPSHLDADISTALKIAHPYEEPAYEITQLLNPNPYLGMGAIGELEESMNQEDFLRFVSKTFKAHIRHSKLLNKEIKTVAVLGGSGSFGIKSAIAAGADAYITGDLKYHDFFLADDKILLCDVGHYESEQY